MPKQELTGTLDEQCDFLYKMAQEKMAQGNFTGAVHALKEVVKYAPDFRDASRLLQEAQRKKKAQSRLLLISLLGAAIFVGVGTWLQVTSDWLFLAFALVGALLGFGVGNLLVNPGRNR
ncbi:MAG: hypothetical protein R3C14_53630 [Caldilineaceae bacterium]